MNRETLIEKFKQRKIKANEAFAIKEVSKDAAYDFVKRYHYLGNAKFFAKYSYGLFLGYELVGVATFACPLGTM